MLQYINGKMKYKKKKINLETLNLRKKKRKNNFIIKYSHKTLQCINRKREYKRHVVLETLNL